MPDVKDIVLLSDNVKYVVANKILYKGKNFYIFVDFDTQSKIKILGEGTKKGEPCLKEVKNNDKLLLKLLKLFNEHKVV